MLATLLLSQGTPMLLAGDEFGRTQHGNNNAFCQDNEVSWLDWNITDEGREQIALVTTLIALRQKYPILHRGRFFTGHEIEGLGVRDVTWINATGAPMQDGEWDDRTMKAFGMLIDGRAQATGIRRPGSDTTVLIVLNAHHDTVPFTLPKCANGTGWDLMLDTNAPGQTRHQPYAIGQAYSMASRSLLLFALMAAV